jgi:hypothetical protein
VLNCPACLPCFVALQEPGGAGAARPVSGGRPPHQGAALLRLLRCIPPVCCRRHRCCCCCCLSQLLHLPLARCH